MRKALGVLLLGSLVFSLPFAGLTPVAAEAEETIMALDICGHASLAGTDTVPTLSEPVFTVNAFCPETSLSDINVSCWPYLFTSLIEKPPRKP